jgi:glycosyltransferase involved in cell wall biosynthesis
MPPLVSVGFLVWNDVAFLRRALDSLLAQTHQNLEIIISDDASSDGSAEICREYAARDPRIAYFRHEVNRGISRNMEFTLAQAHGAYFFWAADDDGWDPNFVETLLQALLAHPDCIVAFCPYQLVDEADRPLPGDSLHAVDYSHRDPARRIEKLARFWDDGFGYGLFRRTAILDCSFPVWWWVNADSAYDNIYPTLCFHLARGGFQWVDGPPRWFNRIKERPLHHVPFQGRAVRQLLARLLRHVNCHAKCVQGVYLGSRSPALVARVYPALLMRLSTQLRRELRRAWPARWRIAKP